MESCTENKKNNAFENLSKSIVEDKDKIILSLCLASAIILSSVTCAIYGSNTVDINTIYEYCTNPTGTAIHIAAVTVGFILILLILGTLRLTRLMIYPAVCFRGLGFGALICGILQAGGDMGLCFTALAVLPYCVVNSALAVYAGEFSLGIRRAFAKKHTTLAKGLIVHTLKIFAIYLVLAAASCVLFVVTCYAFGKYLM